MQELVLGYRQPEGRGMNISGFRSVLELVAIAILILSLFSTAEAGAAPGQTITVSPSPDAFKSGGTTMIGYTLPDIIDGNLVVTINDSAGDTVWSSHLPDQHAGPGSITWNGRDNGGNQVPEGQYTVRLTVNNGTFGTHGEGDGQFWYPSGITINSTGYIYVTDTNNGRVQVFDSNGNYLAQFGTYGTEDGQFRNAIGVAVNSTGHAYVVDAENHCVKVFDSNGNYLTKIGALGTDDGQFQHPIGIAINSTDYVYVADTSSHRVQVFDSNGNYLAQFGTFGIANGRFYLPYDVAINGTGHVYVADTHNHRVQVFDSDGNYLARFGTWGTGDGQFGFPVDLAINSTGYVYVADSDTDRIQVFDPNGNYLARFGTPGTGDGQFDTPTGIVADCRDNVYVIDTYNNRVQVFYTGVEGSAYIYVDDTAPSVELVTGVSPNNGWYNVEVPCALLATDNPGGSGVDQVRYSPDNVSWQTGTTFTVTTEGSSTVYWNCTDRAGNSRAGSQVINVDRTAPVTTADLAGTRHGGAYTSSGTVTLASADDTTGVNYTEYRVNDGNWQRYSGPVHLHSSCTINYRSADLAGNLEAEKTLSFARVYLPPATISMDEMYGRQHPTPTLIPATTPTASPAATLAPTVTAAPTTIPTTAATPTTTPGEPQTSGYLLWVALGLIAIVIVAGVYCVHFLFFRK